MTEAVLRKALEPVGFVWELRLPRNPDGVWRGPGLQWRREREEL